MATDKQIALAKQVEDYAQSRYGKSRHYAWDEIVECWTTLEIVERLEEAGITAKDAAIRHFRNIVKLFAETRNAIRAEAF